MRPLKEKISITIDSDLLEKLREKADEDCRPLSQYINLILRKYMEQKEKKQKSRCNLAAGFSGSMSMKRNAVHVAAVRTQVHLVVPHLIAVNIGVNVPADAVVFAQIYPAEIVPFPEWCKHGSGLKQGAGIV